MKSCTSRENLAKERSKCSFLVSELTYVLDGNESVTVKRRSLENLIFGDQNLFAPDVRRMSRDEKFKELLRRHIEILKKCLLFTKRDTTIFKRSALNTHLTGLIIHETKFIPQLKLMSSNEQLREWLPLANSFEMIGCYSQMELGHGLNVKDFETCSIYDPKSEEFILNTPTISSTKWWVGGLARTANHCLVEGHLYSKEKYLGLHTFLVQIRDHNHNFQPGVIVGDVGEKMGLEGVDYGFLKLDNVRIPRKNMLMRAAKVVEDGSFTMQGNEVFRPKIEEMIEMCRNAVHTLCMSITISIRYSSIRQQSSLGIGQAELQVLDYQTQQDKLFPIMCSAIAFKLILNKVNEWIEDTDSRVLSGNGPKYVELCVLVSGLKVLMATESSKSVELCRIACGGHGFSAASNFPAFYKDLLFSVTEEEELMVHPETSRFLVENLTLAERGMKMKGFFKYMEWHNKKFSTSFTLDSLLEATGVNSLRILKQCKEDLRRISGDQLELEWSDCSDGLKKAIMAHVKYAIAVLLVDEVRHFRGSVGVGEVLERICRLHLVHELLQASGDLVKDGYLIKDDVNDLREELYSLYGKIRPDAISLVDAFDFHDKQLNSVLGSYGGDVYKELFDWAQESQLNEVEVHSSFYKYLKPIRTMDKAKL